MGHHDFSLGLSRGKNLIISMGPPCIRPIISVENVFTRWVTTAQEFP